MPPSEVEAAQFYGTVLTEVSECNFVSPLSLSSDRYLTSEGIGGDAGTVLINCHGQPVLVGGSRSLPGAGLAREPRHIKQDEILPLTTGQTDLESIILSEVSQTEKHKHHMISLMYEIRETNNTNKINEQAK